MFGFLTIYRVARKYRKLNVMLVVMDICGSLWISILCTSGSIVGNQWSYVNYIGYAWSYTDANDGRRGISRGKRKANSSFEVVDARSSRKTNVSLPVASCLETVEEAEKYEENVQGINQAEGEAKDTNFDDSSEHDSDIESNWIQSTATYKKRRERLSSNWEKIRQQLLRTSLAIEGFIPSKCSESTCSEAVKARCKDCGFSAYYCKECCDNIHKEKLHFHDCEIFEEGLWKQYSIPGRILHNERHHCEGTHLKPITVVDLKGFHHEILFEYCTCFGVPESLLHCGIWPATPVEPNLGFTLQLMEMTLRLVMECHVSIHDMLKTLDFFKNPVIKKKKIYDQFIESFEEYRYHLKTKKVYSYGAESVTCAAVECPACPKTNGKCFVSADACFGLPRKKASGFSYREPLSAGMYFHEQHDVDQFMSTYPKSTKESQPSKMCK